MARIGRIAAALLVALAAGCSDGVNVGGEGTEVPTAVGAPSDPDPVLDTGSAPTLPAGTPGGGVTDAPGG